MAKKVPKVTNAESALRTKEIYGYLTRGYSRGQIIQECADWGLSDRMIDTYVKKARDLLEKDCEMARPASWLSSYLGYASTSKKPPSVVSIRSQSTPQHNKQNSSDSQIDYFRISSR